MGSVSGDVSADGGAERVVTAAVEQLGGLDGVVMTTGPRRAAQRLADEQGVRADGVLERVIREEWGMDGASGRPGLPEEVADLYAFLLSRRAGYLSGAVINIDGGTDFSSGLASSLTQ